MAATHTLPLASPGMARICLYGDLQRFGRRIDLRVKTGAEAIRALATQLPAFRQKLSDGWYQVRIAGRDVSTSGLTAQLHETLPDGAVIHIVPRVRRGQVRWRNPDCPWGLPPLPDHSLPPEPPLQHGGQPLGPVV
ncbi:phage tail assembly protein [Escherichia coli]|uniref:Phage tail assembly protein n=1 Tax=Escherichia coli TaxID=562 RepID=A0A376YCM2_ECOLX|nr:phage tail assembly protein [Escherichia coli]